MVKEINLSQVLRFNFSIKYNIFLVFFRDEVREDFETREHVQRVNFEDLKQHFISVQKKHMVTKHKRPAQQQQNLLSQ